MTMGVIITNCIRKFVGHLKLVYAQNFKFKLITTQYPKNYVKQIIGVCFFFSAIFREIWAQTLDTQFSFVFAI